MKIHDTQRTISRENIDLVTHKLSRKKEISMIYHIRKIKIISLVIILIHFKTKYIHTQLKIHTFFLKMYNTAIEIENSIEAII